MKPIKALSKSIVSFAKSIVSYGNLCVVLSKPLHPLSESVVLHRKLMVLYWRTLVLLNESVVFWIAGGCEAHPCVHIKMAGVRTRGFRNIPI